MTKIRLTDYRNIVILTGAGISVASGLRPFCGPDGIWDEYDVANYGHVDRLTDAPDKIWALFGPGRKQACAALPNAAHRTLAEVENRLLPSQQMTLITQNIDGLHQRAGSNNVIEIHGNLQLTRCSSPDCSYPEHEDESDYSDQVPRCSICNSPLRPSVVLFGEMLPVEASWHAKRALRDCDLFIAIEDMIVVSEIGEQ